mgnify:FL=1
MNKLKILLVTFFFILIALLSVAQKDMLSDIEIWKNQTDYIQFLNNNDVSPAFFYEDASYLGIFGENKYKINIRFDEVSKESDEIYSVIGQSRLKGKIVGFTGEINIERIEFVHLDIDMNELWLVLVGTYNFFEDDKKGVFQGSYRKYLIYSWKDNSIIPADNHMELSDSEGYAGVWKNLDSMKEYSCLFGFSRYSEELGGDFDNRGGEPIINLKYKNSGWETQYTHEVNIGYYWNVDSNDKWWIEK